MAAARSSRLSRLCLALIAFPLLAAEYAIGRRSGHSAVESVQALARASGKSELWGGVAWLGMLSAFFILTFYCVVSAWFMAYIPFAVSGVFAADVGIDRRIARALRGRDVAARTCRCCWSISRSSSARRRSSSASA